MVTLILLAGFGIWETMGGIADVVTLIGLVWVLSVALWLVALAIAGASRSSGHRWPTRIVAGLNILIVVLALGAAFASYRGHTAADRFADKVREFPLPASFVVDDGASAAQQPSTAEGQYVARVWKAGGTGEQACDAVGKAYRSWTSTTVRSQRPQGRCIFSSPVKGEQSRVELKGSTVVLEMWVRTSQPMTF
ncbi:MAG: hypothetical protein M3Q98_14930 [Actinomycetota bacterium]|nr:hypothetical protein [Actinomycetota bacterium]